MVARVVAAAQVLGLSQSQQARLLGLAERTFRRLLKKGRLEATEARPAVFLPKELERIEALFQEHRRARAWLTTHNPRFGAVPAARLGDLEGHGEVLLVAKEAYYGFL